MCGRCTFCTTGAGVDFNPIAIASPDPRQVQAILNACGERDDARLLARFAFGITSPRLNLLKCSSSHPLFGSMGTVDFNALVAVFETECAKAGGVSVAVASVATTARNRTHTEANTTSSRYSKPAASTSYASTRGRGRGRGSSGAGRNHYKRVRY